MKLYPAIAIAVGLAASSAAFAAKPAQPNSNKPVVFSGTFDMPDSHITYAVPLEPGYYEVRLQADPKAELRVYPPETFDEIPVPCTDSVASTHPETDESDPAECTVQVRTAGQIGVTIEPIDLPEGDVLSYKVRIKRIRGAR
jgi:hypothetical protein